ncbi:hypothetical protein [Mucilaginibacter sp. dw_454]|uniref:hypothetical protein n=1 Tax=Mucilaginibacter sp. dw_454 TaxID=2720079 RepID=UPI001BD3BB6E|nr:hypothetical protein [Mucilaginibacter sp. dw_454]
MKLKNSPMAPRGKRRLGIFFLATFSILVLIIAIPSLSNGQTYDTTITSNGGTVSSFQDETNTYFHSEWETGFSVDGTPCPAGVESTFDWAVNNQTLQPAVGSGYYTIKANGGIVSQGYGTNDEIQTDHQLMDELNAGITIYNYLDGVGSLLYQGIKNAYEYYYPGF